MKWLGTIGFLIGALLQLKAAAAPWHVRDGTIYGSATISRGEVEGLQNTRASFYAEYGLSPDRTLTTKFESVDFHGASDFNSDAWRATLRRTYSLSDTVHLSFEGGLLQGEAIGGFGGCRRLGSEVRSGIAWSRDVPIS